MNPTLAGFLYLIAAIAFILGIKRLASPATARSGNQYASAGMLLAVVVTLVDRSIIGYGAIIAGMVVGGGVARKWDKWGDRLDETLPVVPAARANNAGIVGAATLVG